MPTNGKNESKKNQKRNFLILSLVLRHSFGAIFVSSLSCLIESFSLSLRFVLFRFVGCYVKRVDKRSLQKIHTDQCLHTKLPSVSRCFSFFPLT